MIRYSNRNLLIDSFQKNLIVAEIGVFKGDFSKIMLNLMKPKELHLIDIFEGMMCSGDKDGNNVVWTNLNHELEILKKHFSENENVFIHKGKSEKIMLGFSDDYFDVVYIDGDHSYEGVKRDLEVAYKKVKKGGLICGHDYGLNFISVMNAVNEFCTAKKLKIDFLTNDGCPSFGIKKI